MFTVLHSARFRIVASWPRYTSVLRCATNAVSQLRLYSPCGSFKTQLRDVLHVDKARFDNEFIAKSKQRNLTTRQSKDEDCVPSVWELTVGIEVHAQLNTERKLFSRAATSVEAEANSHLSVFDLAFPGTQPEFQKATLVPALRAALAFECKVCRRSQFDRKHYFYQDQPAGYQITQYYEPYARDGTLVVHRHDGIAPADGESITIGIKQIHLEQDTAKTIHGSASVSLLDFNRVSHPLIEIITLPQIHHPKTAAACVKKIQATLQAVNAVTTGMELGGLRADVNVSVRRRGSAGIMDAIHVGDGVTCLGQRTEIKNLSSFAAIEDAIAAERDRQIQMLESGGVIKGETRGWTIGMTETKKLRDKEGEVDYRYLPDPDLPPLLIDTALVEHVRQTMPKLPDVSIHELMGCANLNSKDVQTLVTLNDGARLDYYDEVLDHFDGLPHGRERPAKLVANWVLHELGGLLSAADLPFSKNRVSTTAMASILKNLLDNRITGTTAKRILAMVFEGDSRPVADIIAEENLELQSLPREEYLVLAQDLIKENGEMVKLIRGSKNPHGKIMWFVGQMMRKRPGKIEARKAEAVLMELLGL